MNATQITDSLNALKATHYTVVSETRIEIADGVAVVLDQGDWMMEEDGEIVDYFNLHYVAWLSITTNGFVIATQEEAKEIFKTLDLCPETEGVKVLDI